MNRQRNLYSPSLVLGGVIVLGFLLIALAAPLLAPPEGDDAYVIPRDGFAVVPQPPGPGHPLGTMEGQGDVFYGLVWGTRIALRVGLIVTLGRLAIGFLPGLLSGYYAGVVDAVIMRTTDAFLSFPLIAAVMVMLTVFVSPTGPLPQTSNQLVRVSEEVVIIAAMIIFGWMSYTRLIRGNVLATREQEFVQAARSTGATNRHLLFRHILPNSTQGVFVLLASDVGAAVVWLATLGFIGLIRHDLSMVAADWGRMLSLSRNWIIGSPSEPFKYWHTYVPVSAAIVLFATGWHLVGDGLRDLFDPRTRQVDNRSGRVKRLTIPSHR